MQVKKKKILVAQVMEAPGIRLETAGIHLTAVAAEKNGEDRSYGERLPIFFDKDAREEYKKQA